jgi:hypothetical protein
MAKRGAYVSRISQPIKESGMKYLQNVRVWLAVLTVAILSMVLAPFVVAQNTPGGELLEPGTNETPSYSQEPRMPAPTEMTEDRNAMMERSRAAMRSALLPMVVGIGAGDMGAAALHELAASGHFERRDARSTARLAKESVALASERAGRVHEMPGLSADSQAAARSAKESLSEAQNTIDRIDRAVGDSAGTLPEKEAVSVRSEALKLHAALSNASMAIDKIAGEYQISTKLNFMNGAGSVVGRDLGRY